MSALGGRGRGGSAASRDDAKAVLQPNFDKEVNAKGGKKGSAKGGKKGDKGRGSSQRSIRASPFQAGRASEEIYEDGFCCHQRLIEAHDGSITAVCVTADAIYTASRDEVLKRWKPQRNEENRFELLADLVVPLGGACWSMLSLGDWIFCGLDDGRLRAFSKGGADTTMKKHSKGVSAMIVHEDVLVTGGADGVVCCWVEDKQSGSFTCSHRVENLIKSQVRCLAAACGMLWVGGAEGLTVVDLSSLGRAVQLPPVKKVAGLLAFQDHVISVYADGSSYVFDGAGKVKHSQGPLPAGPVLCIAGLECGPRVLCGHVGGQISSVSLPSFELQTCWQAAQEKCQVRCITSACHDGIFIVGSESGDLQVWQRNESVQVLSVNGTMQACKNGAPLCDQGHLCRWSSCSSGVYARGWRCNLCSAKRKGERWHCEACKDDLCFECFPLRAPGRSGEHKEAQIVNGKWVQVRKHSGMGCAVVTFTEQRHRDLVLAQLVKEPAVLGGISIEVKPHLERQEDGSRAEIPQCAFAGWKQPKEEGACKLLARTLQIFLDRCCEKANGPAPVISLD